MAQYVFEHSKMYNLICSQIPKHKQCDLANRLKTNKSRYILGNTSTKLNRTECCTPKRDGNTPVFTSQLSPANAQSKLKSMAYQKFISPKASINPSPTLSAQSNIDIKYPKLLNKIQFSTADYHIKIEKSNIENRCTQMENIVIPIINSTIGCKNSHTQVCEATSFHYLETIEQNHQDMLCEGSIHQKSIEENMPPIECYDDIKAPDDIDILKDLIIKENKENVALTANFQKTKASLMNIKACISDASKQLESSVLSRQQKMELVQQMNEEINKARNDIRVKEQLIETTTKGNRPKEVRIKLCYK